MFDGGPGGRDGLSSRRFSHAQSLARSTWFEAFVPYDILFLARARQGWQWRWQQQQFVNVYFSIKNDRGISLPFKVRVTCALRYSVP